MKRKNDGIYLLYLNLFIKNKFKKMKVEVLFRDEFLGLLEQKILHKYFDDTIKFVKIENVNYINYLVIRSNNMELNVVDFQTLLKLHYFIVRNLNLKK